MKLGVLVFNLGGPESLRDVKPFLYRLFSDPEIIRIKWSPLRKTVAYAIATLRKNKSQGYYRLIGGGSPLRRLTEEQAAALESELQTSWPGRSNASWACARGIRFSVKLSSVWSKAVWTAWSLCHYFPSIPSRQHAPARKRCETSR